MHLTEEDYEILHGIRPGRVARSIANVALAADRRDYRYARALQLYRAVGVGTPAQRERWNLTRRVHGEIL